MILREAYLPEGGSGPPRGQTTDRRGGPHELGGGEGGYKMMLVSHVPLGSPCCLQPPLVPRRHTRRRRKKNFTKVARARVWRALGK